MIAVLSTPMPGVTLTSTFQTLPGRITFTVPIDQSMTLVAQADGSLLLAAASSTSAYVELRMVFNGTVVETLKTQVLNYRIANMSSAWHMHTVLPAGPTATGASHELRIEARLITTAGFTTGSVQINNDAGRFTGLLFRAEN